MAAKPKAGVNDNQTFFLNCPSCRRPLDCTKFQTGPLDKMRGVHQMHHYGWVARCADCDRTWGDFLNPMLAPSMWVLKDLVEKDS